MIVHLRADTVSLVIDARELPTVVHWGAPLGDLSEGDLVTLADGAVSPVSMNAPGVPVPIALLPSARAGYPGRPGLRGHRSGVDWLPSLTLTSVKQFGTTATFEYSGTVRVVSTVELTTSGVVRVRHTVSNDGAEPYVVDGVETALPVPAQATELLDFTGRWSREKHPQRRSFDMGSWVRENRRGRTGHDATLALLAGTAGFGFRTGEVWAVHVAWSGNHVTYAERVHEARGVLGGGELLTSGEVILAQGETYESPWLYAAYSATGIDGISAAFHTWMRSRATHPTRSRPVVLNTWEAVYFDHDLNRLQGLADVAARVGVERFVLDDGWFRHRRDDTAGLGDWYVDEGVWPAGLTPLIKHVTGLGMEFGIWVEPEMVNPDSDLYRAHPDWVLAPGDGSLPPPSRQQQVVDLANPDAFAYILDRLDELLRDNDIAFLKWDHNRDLIAAGHGDHPGVRAQTLAAYRLFDELRARHPNVEIESCSSGGGRTDLEILARTDRVWASDCNDALERQTIQRWTALLLPLELIGAHVGPAHSHTTGRTQDLSFRVATALFGHFGIEWDIASESPEEQAALAEAVAFVKEVRRLLHTGELVRGDHPDPSASVTGVVAEDGALFSYAQLTTSERTVPPLVRLPGLDPDRRYTVTPVFPGGRPKTQQLNQVDESAKVLTGRVLGEVGVRLPNLMPEQAWLLRVTPS
ncbi:alpha-galactosidase [Actinophytocola sp.]|uniref:alpha-galactosidase n=1 Tax=Actinophytocola sp. TaxID=1872138 RepID=UPI002ECFC730